MSTPEAAVAKYDRKVNAAAWSAGVAGAGPRYAEGMQRFLGVSPTRWIANYQAGIADPAAAAAYAAGTQGGGARWLSRFREAAQRAATG